METREIVILFMHILLGLCEVQLPKIAAVLHSSHFFFIQISLIGHPILIWFVTECMI